MSRLICLGAQKNSLIENVLLSTHKATYKSPSRQHTFVVDSEKIITVNFLKLRTLKNNHFFLLFVILEITF